MSGWQPIETAPKDGMMATMTFNLSDREMEVLTELAREQELSKTALLKQALRLYQFVISRLKDGESMHFSGDKERLIQFVGPGFTLPPHPSE